MARTLIEATITTRNSRAKLDPGVHFKGIDPEVHLGYRKGKRGGVWLVRWRNKGEGANYLQAALGTADDAIQAGTLDYNAAVKAAREYVEHARIAAAAIAAGPAMTVRSSVEGYVADRDARDSRRAGRPIRSDAGRRLRRYVLGQPARGREEQIPPAALSMVELHKLSERDLLEWRIALPHTLKSSSRQRLVNDLKAALNTSYAANRDRVDGSFPGMVKHGLRAIVDDQDADPVARDNQILADGEIARLLKVSREFDEANNWDGDLFRLILILAATGARFSQVVRMKVSDCQIKEARLLVPVSRKGRGVKSVSITVPVGADVLEALAVIVHGRPKSAPLLERWRNEQAKGEIRWHRSGRGPWHSSSDLVRPWHEIRKAAGLPDVIPYALRHSSIVKGIRANLPIRLVAALHDTSTAMIERHYSKWITTGLEDLARAAITPLVPNPSNLIEFKKSG